ncbi:RNA polymerase sigma-70 factor [Paraburkholderia megapolitana]|uniref:RNA polymerase sigma-70 factor, ECF subfamily n=1 Tax=Paraburkholderia megapolitana TaxID=420953 RepID=A0A1I3IPM1_9BURK|nr:RNA polymerase sigma-70 factor [Paraburkholderia megapolitana]QDQ86093.1 RNA polymerase sigma-70 factor [Paraburkholderia megapolitana]SFI49928.1 RNA polymerase sigma-70 factor, ECF subfamily [Paraburkholderia megapolitana]
MDIVQTFIELKPRLFGIAYRMLGTRTDAEDVVQDAWLRWHEADHSAMRSMEAWLVTVVTRLSIDRLRSRKSEQQSYIGWWLPEPLVELDENTPEAAAEFSSDLSVAFLWVLERLSPDERAAFLLREAFDLDYREIASILGKTEAACRQIVRRAGERIREGRPRFEISAHEHRDLLSRFLQAASTGDREAMKTMLAPDVELVSDGGGKVSSFGRILKGAARIAGVFWSLEHAFPGKVAYRMAWINGEPGLLRYIDGKIESASAFTIHAGRISDVYIVRNPDKLGAVPPL